MMEDYKEEIEKKEGLGYVTRYSVYQYYDRQWHTYIAFIHLDEEEEKRILKCARIWHEDRRRDIAEQMSRPVKVGLGSPKFRDFAKRIMTRS